MKAINALGLAVLPVCTLLQLHAATLFPNPASGNPGAPVQLRGTVSGDDPRELRFYWEQAGALRPVARGAAGADGVFSANVTVPADALVGFGRWAMLPAGR